ncbi:MAG: TetR/AcrR family transcriptional regulator [Verrucomicrobiia bacterium]
MSERSLTPDTMATTTQHRLEQRDKVLHAARTCFIQHGFHSTGMAEVAKACGMSVGNTERYFPASRYVPNS